MIQFLGLIIIIQIILFGMFIYFYSRDFIKSGYSSIIAILFLSGLFFSILYGG